MVCQVFQCQILLNYLLLYKINDISLDLPEDYENNVVTEYERKFRDLGVTINYMNVEKVVKKWKIKKDLL